MTEHNTERPKKRTRAPGGGRKNRKGLGAGQTITYTLRLSDEQAQQLDALAAHWNLTRADAVRMMITKAAEATNITTTGEDDAT